jgi:hypothetical protein
VKSKQPGRLKTNPHKNERACRFRHVLKGPGSFLEINPNGKESMGSDTVNTVPLLVLVTYSSKWRANRSETKEGGMRKIGGKWGKESKREWKE